MKSTRQRGQMLRGTASVDVRGIACSILRIAICILPVCSHGCASIATHADKSTPRPHHVYSGTQDDLHSIADEGFEGKLGGLGVAIGLFDLPFSFTVDSLLLPYDACVVTAGGKRRNGESQ
jgi:uncharacterized protein YceK